MSSYILDHKALMTFLSIVVILIVMMVLNIILIKHNGKPLAVPAIPRGPQKLGTGQDLSFVVMGDSTAVGQGGTYEKGIAVDSARFIAQQGFTVSYQNLAISGARVKTVRSQQLESATARKPDVVLLAVGANDVTHLTRLADVKRDTRAIIDSLQASNPAVKIILTGSPEMGSVPRFPQPTKYMAELRTASINDAFDGIAAEKGLIRASIAEDTGPIFKKHPELFAQDQFHPNDAGYAVWLPVLHAALSKAILSY